MRFSQPARLTALPPYLFVEIDRKRRAAIEAGQDVINFGVGDPDRPTPGFVSDCAAAAVRDPANHRYPLGIGSAAFREAVADFFQQRYGVRLDPNREILALIGSKEGLGHLGLATLNPGDGALIPDPAYPVYHAGTIFAGGVPHVVPLRADRGWLPDLEAIPAATVRGCKVLFLNYPNNPTGALAPRAFLESALAFARKHELLLVQDAAYNEMYYDRTDRPPSIFEFTGATDSAIELHSLSKTFNMTGWRVGFAVGNADVLASLARVKANVDSGVFTAVQDASIAALAGIERPEIHAVRAMYAERAAALCPALREIGFELTPPRATFYVWARVPRGYDEMQVVNKLLDEACVVCIPGTGFGAGGAGYVRFALTVEVPRIHEAARRMAALRW